MELEKSPIPLHEAQNTAPVKILNGIGQTMGRLALEQFGILDVKHSIDQLDFERYHEERDARLLILDGDTATFPHNQEVTSSNITQTLDDIRSRGFIEEIALVSNNRNLDLARARGKTICADTVITPECISHMKPSDTLIQRALTERNANADIAIGVGDGITDYLAYVRTGLPTALVEGYGQEDTRGYPLRRTLRRMQSPFRSRARQFFN